MNIYDRVIALCAKRGTTKTALESACGFSQNSINKWKSSSPTVDNLVKIAKQLGVSLDYLVGLTENESGYNTTISAEGALPATKQETSVGFPEQYKPLLADEKYVDMTKLYYNIDEMKRAVLFGTVLGCLQTLKVNTKEILGY